MVILAVLPRAANTIAYKAATHELFYCGTSDGRLYKWDLDAPGEVALSWPISSLSCAGYSMTYSATRDSLIFPYAQNNLYGIAEYLLNP